MNFAAGEPVLDDNPVPMAYSADINKKTDPLGYYAIDLLDLNVVHIPAGRLCFFDVSAGRIYYICLTLPLKPLSFDEMKAMAESIDQSFRDAGYVFYHGNTGMTEQSFGENRLYKLDTYGEWQLPDRGKLFEYSLQVATYVSYSNVGLNKPLSPGVSKDAPRTYLIEFRASVDFEVYKELSDFSDARRIAVNHEKKSRYRCSYGLMNPIGDRKDGRANGSNEFDKTQHHFMRSGAWTDVLDPPCPCIKAACCSYESRTIVVFLGLLALSEGRSGGGAVSILL